MSTKFKTGVCRIRYPHLINAREPKEAGKKPSWQACLLIPKSDTETMERLRAAQEEALVKKFGNQRPKKLDMGLRDGDEDAEDKGQEYIDHWYINPKNYNRAPGVINRNKQVLTDVTDVVDGDYVKALIDAYGFDREGKRGVTWDLQSVLFWERGEPLGHVTRPEDAFADDLEPAVAGDDDDEFL